MARRLYRINSHLDTNEAGLALIRSCEKFMPTWYLCPAKVFTIGFGTTENSIHGVNRATVKHCDRAQAEEWMRFSVASIYEPEVERYVRVPLTENQYSALVSFVYNVGGPAFRYSTLLEKLNAEDYKGAAEQFGRWIMGGGKVLGGLVKRREAERQLFEADMTSSDWADEVLRMIPNLEPLPVMPIEPFKRPVVPEEIELPELPKDLAHLVA